MNKWIELLKNDDYMGIKKYLKSGADINSVNELEESVLYIAMKERCDSESIMLLIENGADIYDFDMQGVSIFDMAITYNYIEIVKYIIAQGIDVNKTMRKSGFTPLMAAVSYSRVEIVKLLLDSGANKMQCDTKGFSSIDFARKMNKKIMLELLNVE